MRIFFRILRFLRWVSRTDALKYAKELFIYNAQYNHLMYISCIMNNTPNKVLELNALAKKLHGVFSVQDLAFF